MLKLTLDRESRTPLQLQIFQFYLQAIQRGDLLCGDKLPSIREQAQALNIAKITVVMAYDKLMAAGLIKSRHGIGYEVIFTTPVRVTPAHVRTPGLSASNTKSGRGLYRCLRRARAGVLLPDGRPRSQCFSPGQAGENGITRQAYLKSNCLPDIIHQMDYFHCVSNWQYLNLSRGINTRAENIIITNGIQEGLSLLSQIFIVHHAVSQQKSATLWPNPLAILAHGICLIITVQTLRQLL